jgi:alkylation response protein AidB-like acyl-CoA dehydrogenase
VAFDDVAVAPQDAIAGPTAATAIERGLRVGTIAAAAEGVGAASAALELAIAYVTERRQYGRLIGSFQALQHLLAEAHVLRETAWSTVLYAAAATDQGLEDAGTAARIAKAHASRAARRVAEGALQAFGGVAFAWEHDYHLLARRAMLAEQRFGDSLHHERRLAEMLAGVPVGAPGA